MRQSIKRAIAAVLLLAVLGIASAPLSKFARTGTGLVSAGSVRAAASNSGAVFALLGGYRSIVADFVWIKAYVEWERRLFSQCLSSLELATAIDPYMTTFWTQGASIIAFDSPHWIIEKLGRKPTAAEEKSVRERQAKAALKYLDGAIDRFPKNADLWLSKGQINIIALSDYKAAQQCYAKVAGIYGKECPIYILRIYSSLLARNGHFKDAKNVLLSILSQLEPDSPIKAEISQNIRKCEMLIQKASN